MLNLVLLSANVRLPLVIRASTLAGGMLVDIYLLNGTIHALLVVSATNKVMGEMQVNRVRQSTIIDCLLVV